MATSRPTIADVARRAGVSKGAVSFALNGRDGVSPETRQRILQAVSELGWKPSHPARSLSVSRALTFGYVFAREPALIATDPFFPSFIAGIETVLAPAGYALILQVVPPGEPETVAYRTLAAEGRVDGVFLSDLRIHDPRIPLLLELGLPAVTLNRPDQHTAFPAVCVDDKVGITQAVQHLHELGHRSIAHVSGPMRYLHARSRLEAWASALRQLGLPAGATVEADFTAAGGATATRQLLSSRLPPTAIVYANDLMAIAGMNVARTLGRRVPDDLSIIGFDGTELGRYVHPALTTVTTNPYGWGQAAAASLLAAVPPGSTSAPDVMPEPAQLEIRESTAPPTPSTHQARRARTPQAAPGSQVRTGPKEK